MSPGYIHFQLINLGLGEYHVGLVDSTGHKLGWKVYSFGYWKIANSQNYRLLALLAHRHGGLYHSVSGSY